MFTIALIAHDGKKDGMIQQGNGVGIRLTPVRCADRDHFHGKNSHPAHLTGVDFAQEQRVMLTRFWLVTTGTTGKRIQQATELAVERMLAGLLTQAPPGESR